jgi:hypothetical protein
MLTWLTVSMSVVSESGGDVAFFLISLFYTEGWE